MQYRFCISPAANKIVVVVVVGQNIYAWATPKYLLWRLFPICKDTLTSFPEFSFLLREITLGTRLRLHGGSLWTSAQRKKYNRWVIFNFPKRSWQFSLAKAYTSVMQSNRKTLALKRNKIKCKTLYYILIAWIKSLILKIDFRIYLEVDI